MRYGWLLLPIFVVTAGCNTNQKAAKAFSDGYQPINETISQTISGVPTIRRMYGVEHYLKGTATRADEYGIDLEKGLQGHEQKPLQSFGSFVCAGKEAAHNTRNASDLISGMSRGLSRLSAEPPKEIGKIWGEIGKVEVPNLKPKLTPMPFDDCRKEVIAIVKEWRDMPTPSALHTPPDQDQEVAAFAAIGVGMMAYEALQKLGQWSSQAILRLTREAAIEKLLQDPQNRAELQKALNILAGRCSIESDEAVKDEILTLRKCELSGVGRLFKRQKQIALIKPYAQYQDLLTLPKASDKEKDAVREKGIGVIQDLEAYDKLVASPHPGFLAAKAKILFQKLTDVVDRGPNWEDALDQLVIFGKLVDDLASSTNKMQEKLKPAK